MRFHKIGTGLEIISKERTYALRVWYFSKIVNLLMYINAGHLNILFGVVDYQALVKKDKKESYRISSVTTL